MNDQITIQTATNADGSAALTVVGEVDLATAPRFRRALDEAASRHSALNIDLRHVTYFDSTGVDVLLTYATKHRIKLTIGENRILADVIKISRLEHVVTLTDGG